MRVLTICKKNEIYGFVSNTRRSSGLYNSTRFIVHALQNYGIQAKIVEVQDSNDIDREVHNYKPTLVIIQALWVVPAKFDVLKKLHPKVKWYCHLHSNMPFLAMEGIAMDWCAEYVKRGIHLIANSHASYRALLSVIPHHAITFLPNVYWGKPRKAHVHHPRAKELHIGCFGAVRPLKNHLLQAMAAIRFANEQGLPLHFYINATRVETGGQPVLKNLRGLFHHLPKHKLVELHWCEPEEFIEILHHKIDIGMQVSLTETFSVVSADYTTAGIPMVLSKEITWAHPKNKALDDSIDSIVHVMKKVWKSKCLIRKNQRLLINHGKKASLIWAKFVTKELAKSGHKGC